MFIDSSAHSTPIPSSVRLAPAPSHEEPAPGFLPSALREHTEALRARAWSRVGDATAEDLVQDTCEAALRYARSFQPGTSLRAWLYGVLDKRLLNNRRRARREAARQSDLAMSPPAWTPHSVETPEAAAMAAQIRAIFRELPEDARQLLTLVDIEERSLNEVAQALNLSIPTIKGRLRRSRGLLEVALRASSIDAPGAGVGVPNAEGPAPVYAPSFFDRVLGFCSRVLHLLLGRKPNAPPVAVVEEIAPTQRCR